MQSNECPMIKIVHRGLIFSVLIGLVSFQQQCSASSTGKVVDFGDKLPDYIKENPHKAWLIKFYTPWCYNCQQIELTYIEAAERIYHAHDHLIVGQVNCDKYERICRHFGINGVPTISYLKGGVHSKYNGLREVDSIVSFAERMNGPDANTIRDCNQIKQEVNRRGSVILYTGQADSAATGSPNYKAFKSVASQMKRDFWFYQIFKVCERDSPSEMDASGQGAVFILKRNLRRWIKFDDANSTAGDNQLESAMKDFIQSESFPVFGPLSKQMMNSTKMLAIAVLDEYKPARKLDPLSKRFYKVFEDVAIAQAQLDDRIVFAWSSDLHAIRKIAISHVRAPNVILLKPDLSHHMLIKGDHHQQSNSGKESNEQLPESLNRINVMQLIEAARKNELDFVGGDSYYHRLARYVYSYLILIEDRYEANPVLTSLVLISLITSIFVLLYKTKTFLRDDETNEHDENLAEPQTNHRKQD